MRISSILFGMSLLSAQALANEDNQRFNLIAPEAYQTEIDSALTTAQKRFAQWFGEPELIDVVLTEDIEAMQAVDVTKLAPLRLVFARQVLAAKQRDNQTLGSVLAHEVCHLWFIEWVKSQGFEQERLQPLPAYGHSAIPDWFDEVVAVGCEGTEMANMRRTMDFELVPMHTYMTQIHPVYAQIKAQIQAQLAARSDAEKKSGQAVFSMQLDDDAPRHFYRQSAWMSDFISSQKTESFSAQWLSQFVTAGSNPDQQAEALGFSSAAALEQSFTEFVQYQRP
ncbi:hypothetical protein CWE22_07900 [Pseudidiomarina aestuarii]|uniref:Peptidase M48 domain-containing protein n=1 Tax=Pseudidiomarina aestuarii TaxID=624146 RepID=A0A7Z6ZVB7_9GAMM|nr:hypothetical protein [Pseudidiomarina aestuarii]RUO42057.1 hypothetical protein CWE22_07900 [Pseudidiomarina aestuarii]